MATKKAVTKKAAPKKKAPNPELYTTLRMIEREGPCLDEYLPFLHDLKSLPADMDALARRCGNSCDDDLEESFKKLKRRKTTQFKPNDRIPLATILKTNSSSGACYDGFARVRWIIEQRCTESTDSSLESLVRKLSLYGIDADDNGDVSRALLFLILKNPALVLEAMELAGDF